MNTISWILAVTVLMGTAQGASSESCERQAVLDTVQLFLDAIAEKSVSKGNDALGTDATFISSRESDGQVITRTYSRQQVLELIGGSREQMLERIWDPLVMIDSNVSMVWAPYDFHVNNQLSHCGTDAFQLIKDAGQWRIASGSYSVRTRDCRTARRSFGSRPAARPRC